MLHERSHPGVAPRPHLAALPPCPHGSISDAELAGLGLRREDVLDASASINPLGPSPRVAEALGDLAARGALERYPEDGSGTLRLALATQNGVAPESAIVANGSVEIFWLLALAYLSPGDRVLVVGPTFGEYARAARIAGASVVEWRAAAGDAFRPDTAAIAAAVARTRPRLVFLCNPNNPTGQCLDRDAIAGLLATMNKSLLVVDEAYAPFADTPPALLDLTADGRLFLVRSLTKAYGLAGLRLGYGLGPPVLIADLDLVRPPWSVNAAALACGLAALGDKEHLGRSQREVAVARTFLTAALTALGLRVIPPSANFVLVEVGDGRAFRDALLPRGVCVRDCASFGLPEWVRIGVRTRAECTLVIDTVRLVLAAGWTAQPARRIGAGRQPHAAEGAQR